MHGTRRRREITHKAVGKNVRATEGKDDSRFTAARFGVLGHGRTNRGMRGCSEGC
jgi:hypothetical protein